MRRCWALRRPRVGVSPRLHRRTQQHLKFTQEQEERHDGHDIEVTPVSAKSFVGAPGAYAAIRASNRWGSHTTIFVEALPEDTSFT